MVQKKKRVAQLAFEALSIEGGLLSPEWLAKAAQLQAGHQTEADYRVEKGLNLRDEIGRYWRIAQAQWGEFATGRVAAADPAFLANRFVTGLLTKVFGFESLKPAEDVELAGHQYPIGHAALGGRVPVVVAPAGAGLDDQLPQFADGARKRSAFGLAQEHLNANEDALWGIACDGMQLRILRDNSSLTRPAWVEADLARIFTEQRYADFGALWLLLHETRFGSANKPPQECILETWRAAGREEGTRARDHLRRGVEEALEALGQGFLTHPDNTALRNALHTGTLTKEAYFQQLLRLVYRLIFLLTAEERGLLHPQATLESTKALYAEGYGVRRLRDRSVRRSAHDRFGDHWEALKIVFQGVGHGEPRLGLPPLGGLFVPDQCPHLDAARLENRALLLAVFRLSWLKETTGLARVNWRDMGPEELGSVYESLLELVPQVTEAGRRFGFATGGEVKGNQRKLTGSYYTPDSLVQMLLDSALEPVIQATLAANPQKPVEALLALTVVDPACGSGHFLLAAARRLAAHVARLQVQGTPSSQDYRKALRQVVGRCIFGVDRNPMALELARTALWLEAMTPDAPLTFVDHHLVCGDALIGLMDLEVLKTGIPGEAFKALTGDDKDVVKRLAKRNRDALKHAEKNKNASLPFFDAGVVKELQQLDVLPDDSLDAVAAKRSALQKALLESKDAKAHPVALAADLFVAAFLAPKTAANEDLCPTTSDLMNVMQGISARPGVEEFARQVTQRLQVMHWKLAFAQVFARGGFDVVLGNPPWERIKLQEQEFFASRDPAIAQAQNKSERGKRIDALSQAKEGTPERRLFAEFEDAKHAAEAGSAFAHDSGRYPLTGTGDVNTYALFAEAVLNATSAGGRAGLVLPSGIATDDSTKAFFGRVSDGRLVSLVDFENRGGLFPAVDSRMKFCLMTIGRAEFATFSFFLTEPNQARDSRRQFRMSSADVARINPNTRTSPVFRSERDAELTKKIYARVPVLVDETKKDGNPWGLQFGTMFHMSNDSGLFHDLSKRPKLTHPVPLYEAKMFHQFDHRWATYSGVSEDAARDVTDSERADPNFVVTPRYWVEREEIERRLADKRWAPRWCLGYRRNARVNDERTTICTALPIAGIGDSTFQLFPSPSSMSQEDAGIFLMATLNSLCFDYVARQKVGGVNYSFYFMRQLPVPTPSSVSDRHRAFVVSRAAALVCSGNDLVVGHAVSGVAPDERPRIRAELDAYFAALYGLSRDELRYILDPADVMGPDYPSETFRVLKEKEQRLYGEYRTRRLVLEAWDRLEKSGELPNPVEPQP